MQWPAAVSSATAIATGTGTATATAEPTATAITATASYATASLAALVTGAVVSATVPRGLPAVERQYHDARPVVAQPGHGRGQQQRLRLK